MVPTGVLPFIHYHSIAINIKNILFIFIALVFACNPSREKSKKLEQEVNLYDLYYIQLLEQNKNFNPININSLKTIKIKEELFNRAIANLVLDSTILKHIKHNFNKDKSNFAIQITDSIKKKIESTNRNLEVMNFFSKPINISNTKKIILTETHHRLGRSDGAVFFSKTSKDFWVLDSTVVLNNYRGGGL